MSEIIGRREMLRGAAALAATGMLTAAPSARGEATRKKVIAVSCSFRKGMTTAAALNICLDAARAHAAEIETELIDLAGLSIPAQLAAGMPLRAGETDDFPDVAKKLADPAVVGILIGSPTYFSNMSSLCKAFLERCGVFRKDGFALRDKVVGLVAVGSTRNGGQELVVQAMEAAVMTQDMIVVGTGMPSGRFGATLWNQNDSLDGDEFGRGLAASLGQRVAEVALRLNT